MPVARELIEEAVAQDNTLDQLDARFEGLGARYSGKVRENYTKDGERLIVVTDRISAFDVILGTIPFKGQVLNQIAAYWFEETKELMANHMIDLPDPQVVRAIECEPIAVEMVVRGYLTGVSSTSIWRAYEGGARRFCGHDLAEGMAKHERLPDNIVINYRHSGIWSSHDRNNYNTKTYKSAYAQAVYTLHGTPGIAHQCRPHIPLSTGRLTVRCPPFEKYTK